MNAFQPLGPLLSFTSASSAPTSVQAVTLDGTNASQVCLTNVDGTNDAVIGWGQNDAAAKLNATATPVTASCYYLPHGQQVIITVAPNSYFTGIAVASTAIIKVQAGYGKK